MEYLSEFIGSLVFLLGGYTYMSNVTLKKTQLPGLKWVDLSFAWSLAVGFGLAIAVVLGGPALLNPGVVFGQLAVGALTIQQAALYLLMEFLAAGVAVALTVVNFYDSFKASEGIKKAGIFSAGPVTKNLPLNVIQEICASFLFLFLVLGCIKAASGASAALQIGVIGFAAVFLLSLTLNLTGFSMNAMRSVFSSIWFAILPIPTKDGEKVDWQYQLIVNLVGSTIGGVLACVAVNALLQVQLKSFLKKVVKKVELNRIIQESVPGKQITMAHIVSSPKPLIYQKLGLDPSVDYNKAAIGIMTLSPRETAIIAADIAMKRATIDVGFIDRFSGTLIVTGRIADVQTAWEAVLLYAKREMGFSVCKVTKA